VHITKSYADASGGHFHDGLAGSAKESLKDEWTSLTAGFSAADCGHFVDPWNEKKSTNALFTKKQSVSLECAIALALPRR
jgi:hypothetical protein